MLSILNVTTSSLDDFPPSGSKNTNVVGKRVARREQQPLFNGTCSSSRVLRGRNGAASLVNVPLMGPDNFGAAFLLLFVLEVGAVVVRVANAPHENDSMNNRSPVPLLNELLVVLGVASLLIRPYKAQNQPRALGMPNGDSAARQPHTQHISSF